MSVVGGHLMLDTLNNQAPLILAFLSLPLSLNNADIGRIAALQIIFGSLTQPVFGWLSDRYGPRWFVGGGIVWMAAFYFLTMLTAEFPATAWLAMPALVLGGVGSGMFHPAGAEQATTRGSNLMQGRAATAASIFFLFGQIGLGLGPWMGGVLLDGFGGWGMMGLCAVVLLLGLWMLLLMRGVKAPRRDASGALDAKDAPVLATSPIRRGWLMLVLFALLVTARMTPLSVLMSFVPKLMLDQGFGPAYQGAVVAALMVGSSLGGVAGGIAADRFGRRQVISVSLIAAVLPLWFFPISSGWASFVLVFAAGFTIGMSNSIMIVLAQSLLPKAMGMASGLVIGYMFTSAAVLTFFVGQLAEVYPLPLMVQTMAGVAIVGVVLSMMSLRADPVLAQVAGD